MSIDNIQDITPRVQYVASTAQDEFDYPFPIFEDGDLVVIVNGVTAALDTDYTVAGEGDDAGGTITWIGTAMAGDELVTIYRDIPIERTSDFQPNGPYASDAMNDELDRMTLVDQQLDGRINRALRIPYDAEVDDGDIELDPTDYANMYLSFDADGKPTPASLTSAALTRASVVQVLNSDVEQSQEDLAEVFGKGRTAAEIAASATPTYYAYRPGDARRFAVLDGTTDDTTALTNWAAVAGEHFLSGSTATALITAGIPMVSNSTFNIAGLTVTTATNNIDHFYASSKTKIKVKGGKFVRTSAGASAYVAGVRFTSCTYCKAFGNEFEGMQWAGVYLDSSDHCEVLFNYMHDALGTVSDSGDVVIYRNSNHNRVAFNRCYGGTNFFGVNCQDPGGAGTYLPSWNKIQNNDITAHIAYGVNVYIGGSQNSYNIVSGNTIEGITGSANSGTTGMGICAVGAGIGGTKITNNIIRNCCVSSTSAANGHGGILVTDTAADSIRVTVVDNTVEGMTQGDGIRVAGVLGGAIVSANTVRTPSTNNGAGPGGGSFSGAGIRVLNSNNVTVTGSEILQQNDQSGIFFYNTANSTTGIKVVGNGCKTAAGEPIRFARDSSYVFTNATIQGNTIETASNTPVGLNLVALTNGSVSGNTGSVGSQAGIAISACTNTRFTANAITTTGTVGVTASGTCTGSYWDISNSPDGFVANTSTGMNFEQLLTAEPASASSAAIVGDKWRKSNPAAAGIPGGYCVTAGNPGTWKNEAAIAA